MQYKKIIKASKKKQQKSNPKKIKNQQTSLLGRILKGW